MKNILFFLLILLSFYSNITKAQTATVPSNGDGSEANPYQIATLNNLYWLSQTNTVWNKNFVQVTDINASDTYNWDIGDHDNNSSTPDTAMGFLPIGDNSTKFYGTYNGQGYTIDSLYINRPSSDYIALFGYIFTGTIDSLGISNTIIFGNDYTGGIVAYQFSSGLNNCSVINSQIIGRSYVGGIVGRTSSEINNSYSTDCLIKGWSVVGGIVGYSLGSEINNSYSNDSVIALHSNGKVGGISGYNYSDIKNCYSSGFIDGYSKSGGLIGNNNGGVVQNCYSSCIVIGDTINIGGLIGYGYEGVYNSFWDIDISGQIRSDGGEGLSSLEMKTICTYLDAFWDFDSENSNGNNDIWRMNDLENDGYPFLFWQNIDHTTNIGTCNCYPYNTPIGDGSESNPYQISSLCDLIWLSSTPAIWSENFIQTEDINASDTYNWSTKGFSPIGNINSPFSGKYNGQGHTIDSLYINRPSSNYIALFGKTEGANINNIGFENIEVYGKDYVGSLVGYCLNSLIDTVYCTGIVEGNKNVGGVIGNNNGSPISYSKSVNIKVTGQQNIGGIVGYSGNSEINNSFSTNSLINGESSIGGIVGSNYNSSVNNSYSNDSIIATEGYAGGITGNNNSDMNNCYSLGVVNGNSNSGGLIGYNSGAIQSCYSSCIVIGDTINIGGLIGYGYEDVYNSFWDIDISGQTSSNGGEGLTSLKMKTICNYLDAFWDFDSESVNGDEDIWRMNDLENDGYPFLFWQNINHTTNIGTCNCYPDNTPIGDGSESNPYQISSLCDLKWLSSTPAVWSENFIQTEDINASGTYNWGTKGFTPIGNSTNSFRGIYNGQGHIIDSIFINLPNKNDVALFGKVDYASIYDIGLTNIEIYGKDYVGALVGRASSTFIATSFSTGAIEGDISVGGMVGSGDLNNCYTTCTVTGESKVGGIIGYCSTTTFNNHSVGLVTGNTYVGGLIGYTGYSINNSFWNTETSGQVNSASGVALSTSEMQNICNYLDAGWDFDQEIVNGLNSTWIMDTTNGHNYPILAWQGGSSFEICCGFITPVGDGTENNPYQISSICDLKFLDLYIPFWNDYLILTNSINASETYDWNDGQGFLPIGNNSDKFRGNFNGQGHIIDSLYINRPSSDYVALFGYNENATIDSLGLSNINFNGQNYVSGLVAYNSNSNIKNSFSNGNIMASGNYVGGIAGVNIGQSIINNTYCSDSINSNGIMTGGFVGQNKTGALIKKSYSKSHILSSGNTTTGGFVGNNNSIILSSFWDTDICLQDTSYGADGLSSTEMKTICTYLDVFWDFDTESENGIDDIWRMNELENEGYPFLSWQGFAQTEEIENCNCYPNLVPVGSGTTSDPYQISSLCHLQWVSLNSNLWDKNFIQTANINARNTQYWDGGAGFSPIGNNTEVFSGVYDGQMYNIDSLFINRQANDYVGLFGYVLNSNISNIKMNYLNVKGRKYTGGFIGYCDNSTISTVGLSNIIVKGFSEYTGGFVAYITNNSIVENAFSKGDVSSVNSYVGGFFGSYNYLNCTIKNSYSRCSVSTTVGYIGGFGWTASHSINSYSEGLVNNNYESKVYTGDGYFSENMLEICTYLDAGWDFELESINGNNDYWIMNGYENGGYPQLAWETTSETEVCCGYANVEGSGTQSDPYKISNLCDLKWITNNEDSWDKYFIQTANINASESYTWNYGDHDDNGSTPDTAMGLSPIGNNTIDFTGSYNGQNYLIDSLYINRPESDFVGLFGRMENADLRNIALTNSNIKAKNYSGLLIGTGDYSTIYNCYSTGIIQAEDYVGGLVGSIGGGTTLDNCYSNSSVSGEIKTGGLVGYSTGYSEITNSYASGNIHGTTSVGGLVGVQTYSAKIINSYSTSAVSGDYSVGGLLGNSTDCCGLTGATYYAAIYYSFSTGSVYATENSVGGLVGSSVEMNVRNCYSQSPVTGNTYVGGLIGRSDYTTISKVYATGSISGGSYSGGLIGKSTSSSVDNSLWDKETTNRTVSSGGGVGLTTIEMHNLCTYLDEDWDFINESINGTVDVWGLNASGNNGYPIFMWQGFPHTECCSTANQYITDVQEACNSYTWINGETYTENNDTSTYYELNTCGTRNYYTLNLTVNYDQAGDTSATVCDNLYWNDSLLTESGEYTKILQTVNGCDSVITLNLTINQSSNTTDEQTACNLFEWIDGNTYTSSNNTATYTIPNYLGCDSIITLDLIINNSNIGDTSATVCDSFDWYGTNYTTSSTPTHTFINEFGCDSVVTLHLTIYNSNTGIDTQTACNSFEWIDGNTYTSSNNTATYTIPNYLGCDSIITLDLIINNSNIGDTSATVCDSFDWYGTNYTTSSTPTHTFINEFGCDSVVTLNLTVNHSNNITDTQSACDSYNWIDGNTYTSSNNTATYLLSNQFGCDSIITLDLTINTVNTSVTEDGITLTANVAGLNYQWIDCENDNSIIDEETNQSFTAITNGSYAVIIDNGICVDTSICYNIISIDIENMINKYGISIYPNPTKEIFTIDFNSTETISKIEISDMNGKIIKRTFTIKEQNVYNLTDYAKGIYLVKIFSEETVIVKKVVLE